MVDILDILLNLLWYLVSYSNISFLLRNKMKPNILLFILGMIMFQTSIYFSYPLKVIIQLVDLIIISTHSIKNIRKNIEATLFQFWLLITIETLGTLLFLTLKITLSEPFQTIYNIIIIILAHLLLKQRTISKFWNLIQKNSSLPLLLTFIFIIYINIEPNQNPIIAPIISAILIIYLYQLLKEKLETKLLEQKITDLTNFFDNYEKEIEEQRKINHEYRNNLLYIRSMVTKNENATEFIDVILGPIPFENYEILKDVQKLQISPLKGFIYYKLLECDNKEIQTTFNIDSNINFKKVKKVDSKILQDLFKIFGILIDNAIEACLESQEKSLSLYIYEEQEELVFQISNTFKGTIHIDSLFQKGYSTKGKGRGHGLHYVKSILKENHKLSLKSEIHDDIFIQHLSLNLK